MDHARRWLRHRHTQTYLQGPVPAARNEPRCYHNQTHFCPRQKSFPHTNHRTRSERAAAPSRTPKGMPAGHTIPTRPRGPRPPAAPRPTRGRVQPAPTAPRPTEGSAQPTRGSVQPTPGLLPHELGRPRRRRRTCWRGHLAAAILQRTSPAPGRRAPSSTPAAAARTPNPAAARRPPPGGLGRPQTESRTPPSAPAPSLPIPRHITSP